MAAGSEVADQVVSRPQDVLALTHDALLLRWRASGVGRESGGAFEWAFLRLFIFAPDGRVARYELFDDNREAEAIARFEELVAGAEPKRPVRRRLRPNAANAAVARFSAAFAARDAAAVEAMHGDGVEGTDHRWHTTYGRDGVLKSLRGLMKPQAAELRLEPIATLGERLSLDRYFYSSQGGTAGRFDIGENASEYVRLSEVDPYGLIQRVELFASDRLGDAVARLYERHAELLPEGPARERATATARAVAVWNGSIDLDRVAATTAPLIECVDHRSLHLWSARGADEFLGQWRGQLDLATGSVRHDDVLALEPHTLLVRQTYFGNERTTEGFFDHLLLVLFAFGADGRLTRAELWEADCEAEALACFDELIGRDPSVSPVGDGRRQEGFPSEPFANAASRTDSELFRCFNRRDWEGVLACVAPVLVFDERRRLVRNTCDRDVWLEQFRFVFDVPNSRFTSRLRATRGERLALNIHRFEGEVAQGGGPLAIEDHFALHEVDADGRIVGLVLFDLENEEAAHAELDARFEAGEGVSTAGIPSRFTAGVSRRDWAALTALCSPQLVEHDHRPVIGLEPTRGAEAWVQNNLRVYIELAPDTVLRSFHVRACEGGWLVQFAWDGTREGGRYEISQLAVVEQDEGDRSRMLRVDVYDLAQLDLALARFAELAAQGQVAESLASFEEPAAGGAQRATLFANAATRAVERGTAALAARDWEAFAALMAPELRHYDRTRVAQLETHGGEWLASFRHFVEMTAEQPEYELLATRGDRLALFSMLWRGAGGDVGPSEIDWHLIVEVNDREEHIAIVVYDSDRLDAAYAELDARWTAYGADEHARAAQWFAGYLHAFAARDWDGMAAILAPDLVAENHRLVSWGVVTGPAGQVSALRVQMELAPDTRARFDHVRTCGHGLLLAYTWQGTHDGGPFEMRFLATVELDADGRARRIDVWEPEQLAQAQARFAKIAARAGAISQFENAASGAWREVIAAWRQRDLERFAALQPSPLRYRDHRRLFQLDLDREGFLEFTRPLLIMRSASAALELLATRGERLALMRFTLEIEDDVVGPSAIDSLLLIETDEGGAIAAYDRYEVDDQDAARAEIQARWEAGERAQFFNAALNPDHSALLERRDWDALAALYSPAVVGHDHRLVGWGTLRGRTDFLQSLRSMEALSPDARIRNDHARVCSRGAILSSMWVGTRDGGAFESPFLVVSELGADGKVVRIDFYDPHHLDRAWAHFAEIAADPNKLELFPASLPASGRDRAKDPLAALVKPNLATASMERGWAAFDALDLDAARLHFAPEFMWEDRRPIVGLSGGLDLMIASARERLASGARHQRRSIVGTAGDRVAVGRVLWAGGPPDGRFEVEFLTVQEVNEAGLCTALIFLDPDDERAAQREAWARWAAIDPIAAPWVELMNEFTEAWNGHDRAGVRACFVDDFVLEDHRHAGLGRIEGAEVYLDSIVVLWDLAPDQRIMFGRSWPVVERHATVVTVRRQGTIPDGGPFETEHLALGLARNGRFTRIEFFEIDALDTALARFAELCPTAAAGEMA